MPTYEYRCKECGDQFDVVQAFSDDALTECTKCSGPLKKVYGNVGISFKGSGFYKNDARGKTSTTTASASTPDTKSDTKAETKSETKTESSSTPDSKPAKSESSTSSTKKSSTAKAN